MLTLSMSSPASCMAITLFCPMGTMQVRKQGQLTGTCRNEGLWFLWNCFHGFLSDPGRVIGDSLAERPSIFSFSTKVGSRTDGHPIMHRWEAEPADSDSDVEQWESPLPSATKPNNSNYEAVYAVDYSHSTVPSYCYSHRYCTPSRRCSEASLNMFVRFPRLVWSSSNQPCLDDHPFSGLSQLHVMSPSDLLLFIRCKLGGKASAGHISERLIKTSAVLRQMLLETSRAKSFTYCFHIRRHIALLHIPLSLLTHTLSHAHLSSRPLLVVCIALSQLQILFSLAEGCGQLNCLN